MKKIKEKPTLSERIKEKAVSTPRELLRKGLDDGSERLRTQLRDTAQHGQADEYGGDTIEDTAARGLRRAEKELTRQRKEKPQEQPPEGGAPSGFCPPGPPILPMPVLTVPVWAALSVWVSPEESV